uniref:ATP synthase subunit 8 n=1 Tax=Vanhornia eucnemidarum TaxID=32432 RepID=Q0H2F9_9HYME|nr:ATP synthase subunit 8 [Vanhornia eucnemidarum]
MPQMSPLLWLILFIFTISSLLLTSTSIYFNFIKLLKTQKKNNKSMMKMFKWKW